jgi:hypothetical protein
MQGLELTAAVPVGRVSEVAVVFEAVSVGMAPGCTAGTVEDAGCADYGSARRRTAAAEAASFSAQAYCPLSERTA